MAKKKKSFIKSFFITIGIIFLIPILLLLISVVFSFFSKTNPSSHMPENFDAYISLPSVSKFANEVLHLKTIDALLASDELASVRSTIRSLRANPFLRSKIFTNLANIRVDAAAYENGFVLIADLGLRSSITRPAHFLLKIFPKIINKVEGLSFETNTEKPFFIYETENFEAYAFLYKNIFVVSTNLSLIDQAQTPLKLQDERTLTKALASPRKTSLRFLVNTNSFANKIVQNIKTDNSQENPLLNLVSSLDFPELSIIDLDLKDMSVSVSAKLPWETNDENLKKLLSKRAKTPSVLSQLPESTSYFSLLSLADPKDLWKITESFFGDKVQSSYQTANKAAKLAFNLDLEQMLFSWIGEEIGVFGGTKGPVPIFFLSIKNERQRRTTFEKTFESLLVDRDISVLIDNQRIPRIVFPRWLSSFISQLGIDLVEPFYMVENGYLWLSSSAETLAESLDEIKQGKVLVKTDNWKLTSKGVSPESSAIVYYNLDRSTPFFLRSSDGVAQALKMYKNGLAVLRTGKNNIELNLSAIHLPGSKARQLPGYPKKYDSRISSPPIVAKSKTGEPLAFWTSSKSVVQMNLSTGEKKVLELDDNAMISLEVSNNNFNSLWAVSERGTIYRCNEDLEPFSNFPLVTGYSISANPVLLNGTLIAPTFLDNNLLFVKQNGENYFSAQMHARLRSTASASNNLVVAIPRSFDSQLYAFDDKGNVLENFPVELSGITSASTSIIQFGRETHISSITESGEFTVWKLDGSILEGFPVNLYESFTYKPVWASRARSWYLISQEGTLWRISPEGTVHDSVRLPKTIGKDGQISAIDTKNKGIEEIFVSGAADAIYAYHYDLTPISGYPVSGLGLPSFIDIDGDGFLDLVSRGANDTIHAYEGVTQ